MLTIEIEPAGPCRWHAYLGDKLLCTSAIPLVEGARALLELGHKGSREVRMCPRGSEWASTKPRKLREVAKMAAKAHGATAGALNLAGGR